MKEIVLDGKTPDIAEENIQKLREIFPDVFTEDKVDFEKLQQVLGDYVEDSNERYNFTWNGKGRALRLSQTPSLGTLRPCKEESKDWDTTENLYIEGDNLEVLKLLQKSYHGKVKMIYIDPPYNTGKDFVYKDNFRNSIGNYKEITGQVDIEGNRTSTNTEASGRYHTDWLNMMYPRLRLARNLLTHDGVIFISIDDNEVDNLKKICNEVFGEDNFITEFIWLKGKEGGNDSIHMGNHYERLLLLSKDAENKNIINLDKKDLSRHIVDLPETNLVEGIATVINKGEKFQLINLSKQKDYVVKIPLKNGEVIQWESYAPQKTVDQYIRDGKLFVGSRKVPYVKSFLKDEIQGHKPSNILDQNYGTTKAGSIEIRNIFGDRRIFSYPKPSKLIKRLLSMGTSTSSVVLDFFSGSSTTAHAVMQLNAEDSGNRKFIMVQLPEATDEKSEAYKAGYMNICEIGKERIRRAGEKIKEEKGLEALNLDVGFKVLKLDTSNIRKWQPDYNDLEQSLMDYVDNYVEGRTELDVVYEIMLKYGLDLTYPVDEFTITQKKVYSIGFGMLLICLDDEITTDVAKGILGKIKELSPESSRVVFKDNGFKSDSNKTNIKEILKSGGIEEFITI
jgi:adenine-specific DNA-methyltransferase